MYWLCFFIALLLVREIKATPYAQIAKLIGTGGSGYLFQGSSVSISSDGNTIAIEGNHDNSYQGAVWIFFRENMSMPYAQMGSKLAVGDNPSQTQN